MTQEISEAEQKRIDEAVKRAFDLHQKNREWLIANEGFAISMQQVVAGGLLLAPLSKWEQLSDTFDPLQVLAVIVAAGVGLIAAIFAAQFRHEYRMWDVKAAAADNASDQKARAALAGRYLWRMRTAMWTSTVANALAVLLIVTGAWLLAVLTTMTE